MSKKSLPSERDLDLESVKRRTELFMKHILPHKGMIYDICIKYSRERKHIEDNYNDALVSLYRFMESYKPHKNLKSWIYISVVRGVLAANKKNNKIVVSDNVSIESIESSEREEGVSCNCMGMDNYYEYYSDDILEALDALNPMLKEAFLLQQAGYTIDEIVEIALQKKSIKSKSAETIKSRIFLAKKQLRSMITPEGLKRGSASSHKSITPPCNISPHSDNVQCRTPKSERNSEPIDNTKQNNKILRINIPPLKRSKTRRKK